MDIFNGISKPTVEDRASKPESSAGRQTSMWAAIALLLVAACAVFFLYRLNRLELQVAHLSKQVEQATLSVRRAEERSETALQHATQAETNAQQAARQRDQAQQAEATSHKEAEIARQQAQAAQQETTLAQQKAEEYRKQREEEMDRLQKVLGQIADTRRTAMGLIMTLGSNSIRFDFDKANLRPENREVLSRIAGVLTALKGYSIYVYGYTDNIGSTEYNLSLSDRRAEAVRNYLVQAGLDPSIISTKGYGKSDPRVSGSSAKARAINRRVEIGIVDSTLHFEGSPPS
jgi:outer membrane protein OmpA-like peptidoglycan-associated protein